MESSDPELKEAVLRFSSGFGQKGWKPDLLQGLHLLLVDGATNVGALTERSPLEPDQALGLFEQLVQEGLLSRPAGQDPGTVQAAWINPRLKIKKKGKGGRSLLKSLKIFDLDLSSPPEDIRKAAPRMVGDIHPSIITGDAREFFLITRVDGETSLETLASIASMPMEKVIRTMVKHHLQGSIDFSEEFKERYLGEKDTKTASILDKHSIGVISALLGSPLALQGLLEMVPTVREEAGDKRLGPSECLHLSYIRKQGRLGEICQNSPMGTKATARAFLELYHRGVVSLHTPEPETEPPRREPKGGSDRPLEKPVGRIDRPFEIPEKRIERPFGVSTPRIEVPTDTPADSGAGSFFSEDAVTKVFKRPVLTEEPEAPPAIDEPAAPRNAPDLWKSLENEKTSPYTEAYPELDEEEPDVQYPPWDQDSHGMETPGSSQYFFGPPFSPHFQAPAPTQMPFPSMPPTGAPLPPYPVDPRTGLPPSPYMPGAPVDPRTGTPLPFMPGAPVDPRTGTPLPFMPGAQPGSPAPTSPQREPITDPKDFVEEHSHHFVTMTVPLGQAAGQLRMDSRKERLVETLAENRHRLREILAMSSLSRNDTCKFISTLYQMGLLDLDENPPEDFKEKLSLHQLRKHLTNKFKKDCFETLEIHPSSPPEEIGPAYDKLKERYDEASYPDASPKLVQVLTDLRKLVEQAYAQIKDVNKRRSYRQETYDESRLKSFAEIQFKKGEVFLFWKQQYELARSLFSAAVDLVPANGSYLAHLAYAVAKSRPGSRKEADKARKMMTRATRLSPRAAQTYLMNAMLEKDLGNRKRCIELVNRAMQVDPGNRDIRKMIKANKLLD